MAAAPDLCGLNYAQLQIPIINEIPRSVCWTRETFRSLRLKYFYRDVVEDYCSVTDASAITDSKLNFISFVIFHIALYDTLWIINSFYDFITLYYVLQLSVIILTVYHTYVTLKTFRHICANIVEFIKFWLSRYLDIYFPEITIKVCSKIHVNKSWSIEVDKTFGESGSSAAVLYVLLVTAFKYI